MVPAWLELLAFFMLGIGFFLGLRRAERKKRIAIGIATVCLILYVGLVRAPELYFEIGPGFLQSRRAELLSTLAFGLPLVGMAALLLVFIFSFGLYELLGALAVPRWLSGRPLSALRGALCIVFLGFGLLAVFGYGSGSPWLF